MLFKSYKRGVLTPIRLLGSGGEGRVWLVGTRKKNKFYAVKEFFNMRSLEKEIDFGDKLCDIKNISHYHEILRNSSNNIQCLLYKYYNGGDMVDLHNAFDFNHFKYKEQYLLVKGIDICKAIHSMHEMNIAHRDIKPENILWHRENVKQKVSDNILKGDKMVLADIGCSHQGKSIRRIYPSITYCPPEAYDFKKFKFPYHYNCDIWSLGTTWLAILYGDNIINGSRNLHGSEIRKKGVSFIKKEYHKEWNNLSSTTKMLLEASIIPNPEDRATAFEIVNIISSNVQV